MISWVTFAIPSHRDFLMSRLALLVTLFLVLTNMFNTINTESPTVEGKSCTMSTITRV